MRIPAMLLLLGTLGLLAEAPNRFEFVDMTAGSGIGFEAVFGPREKQFIYEVNGGGVAFFDYDRDGLADIYLVNGSTDDSPGSSLEPGAPSDSLYRNNGDGTFSDVTERAGVGETRWGDGVAVADYDNDGWTDLYVVNYGPNTLYRNNGDGTFADMTDVARVGDTGYGAAAAFGDYDRDGWVDLYVTNYIDFDRGVAAALEHCLYKGVPVLCGPDGFRGGRNRLYRNNADGTFSDVTEDAGLYEAEAYYSFAAVFEDFDSDGWPDLFVANDTRRNYLYRNLGNGRFEEKGVEAGVAYSEDGRAQASMGVAVGDYDNDGLSDLLVSNFADDYNSLYRNEGDGTFTDASFGSGLAPATLRNLGWGVVFEDLDNDGWRDLVTANGHIYPDVDRHPLSDRYRQPLQFFENAGGRFREVAGTPGPDTLSPLAGRALAAADFDNDGGIDLLVGQIEGPVVLLGNRSTRGSWLRVHLEGRRGNRSAIGARVVLTADGHTQSRSVQSGGSYLSQSDLGLHFGLGRARRVEKIEVHWPGGGVDEISDVEVDRILNVREAPQP